MYISLLLSPSRQEAMLFTCYANSTIPSSILARLVPVLWGHRLCFFLWLMYVELAKGDPDQHITYLLYISTRQLHFSKITTKLEYRKNTFFCKLPMSSASKPDLSLLRLHLRIPATTTIPWYPLYWSTFFTLGCVVVWLFYHVKCYGSSSLFISPRCNIYIFLPIQIHQCFCEISRAGTVEHTS